MATRFSISKQPLSSDKIHQMKDIWLQYYILNRYKRSHDTENHCGYLISLDLGKFIYLFGVLRRFQHCTGHITTGSWKGRGNQYIQFVGVLYCKLPTNGKQLPAFPLETVRGSDPGLRGGRRECYHSATVAPGLS